MDKTVLPARIVDERAVLAQVLLEQDAGFFYKSGLRADSFYIPSHRTIWKAIGKHLETPGATIDPSMVISMLNGDREAVAQLAACLDGAVRSERIAQWHAERVRDVADLRVVMHLGQKLMDIASKPDTDRETVVAMIEKALTGILSGGKSVAEDMVEKIGAVVEDAITARPRVGVIGTGVPDLNRFLSGGFHPGRLYILAGRPSDGKSMLAQQTAHQAIKSGLRVNYHSMEMSAYELDQRWLAHASGVDFSLIQKGGVSNRGDVEKLREWEKWLKDRAGLIRVVGEGGQTCTTIQAEIHRWKPHLVVVDYVQLLVPESAAGYAKATTRDREISIMTKKLKEMAMNHNCAVLALSQMNRNIEHRGGGPQLSDLRESGGLESDADVVMMLWEPEKTDGVRTDNRNIRVAKNRNGITGVVDLVLVGEKMRMVGPELREFSNPY